MAKNIKSKNQKGGITANNVNIQTQYNIKEPQKQKKKIFPYVVGSFAIIGTIIAILVYFGIQPKEQDMDKEKEKEAEVNVTSYNQSGGIIAHTVNVGTKPRHVTEEVRKELDKNLASDKDKEILVLYAVDDSETVNFAYEIKQYLESKGYKIKGFGKAIFGKPKKGVVILDKKDGSIDLVIGSKQ